MNIPLGGIIIVLVITYFIGKAFFALVGSQKGCLGCVIWGCLLLATILTGNIMLIAIYVVVSVFVFGR